jgi:hypothetical protein
VQFPFQIIGCYGLGCAIPKLIVMTALSPWCAFTRLRSKRSWTVVPSEIPRNLRRGIAPIQRSDFGARGYALPQVRNARWDRWLRYCKRERLDLALIVIDWSRTQAPRWERASAAPNPFHIGGATNERSCHDVSEVLRKANLYGQGIKLVSIEACEISRRANQYIDDHPEIIALASARYRSLVASGRLRPPRKPKLCNS